MIEFFHYLHIAAGIIIGGSEILFGYVILPAMLKLDPPTRRDQLETMTQYAGRLFQISALVLVLAAIGRVWAMGIITSIGDLFTGYGLLVTLSLVVLIAWQAYDGPQRGKLTKAAEALDTERFTAIFHRTRLVSTIALVVLVGLMGAMRLGLY